MGARLTIEDFNDLEEIKRVKYAYLRCLDQKDWAGMTDIMVPEATAAYSGGAYSFDGRDEIVAFLVRTMGRETFHSSHRAHHPEISLDGDTATATWALEDIVVDAELGFVLIGAAFYDDTYVRRAGEWRLLHTEYRRSFETIFPINSIEGFALTASWWGTDGRSTLPAN